ncbi:ATP-dependent RNA helicase DDX51/DBP6 [Microdochium nivale]|nr:ATP-dependent RNA helicase DDX51/DBP6 [Microdochium nivale]
MYARYIPSAAGATSVEPPQAPLSAQSQSAGTATMAAPTAYARYVPGDATQAPESQDERPTKKAKLSPEPEGVATKPKKKRKSKQRTSAVDSDSDESSTSDAGLPTKVAEEEPTAPIEVQVAQDSTTIIVESPPTTEIEPVRKKPKREKKSKTKATGDTADAESDDEIQKRHKAVFERKRKSIQVPTVVEDQSEAEDATMEDAPSPEQAHGLEPLPQPKPTKIKGSMPTFETLPAWLADPIRVSPQASADFVSLGSIPELGVSAEVAAKLSSAGYKNAFAIQTAVIPLLLPHHCKSCQGDVLVSAATGSGKTLSYALPMIRDLSYGNRRLTRLRALVVLPTRELVRQAQQVCEELAGVFALDGAKRRVRIGVSMGSQNLEKEQNAFIERTEKYDPEAFAARKRRGDIGDYGNDTDATDDEEKKEVLRSEDRIETLPEHVIQYKSKIDILICTPGRLVEHIKYTPGFSIDYVRWLVVDEADKLLGQDFQQWLDVVIPRLHETQRSQRRNHHHSNLSGVRKVILSATMTRDLERLGGLKLRRPNLVVLEGSGAANEDTDLNHAEHALPELLEESALKVSDPSMKPVFLVDLLRSRKLLGHAAGQAPKLPSEDADTSSSESELASDSSSEEETSSESDQDSDGSSRGNTLKSSSTPSVLIFTKSNETAMRLSRLLSLISPTLTSLLGTLTSTTAYTTRRQTLRDFAAGKLRVLVASDLVARGIDLPSLDHVVNYDMPTSIASYVHRVGRTARAGKSGKAWTLFTKPEARWFWAEIAGNKSIKRAKEVQRIRITEEKEDMFDQKVKVYEAALEALGQEAGEMRKRGHK